jgi:hypothetical protein
MDVDEPIPSSDEYEGTLSVVVLVWLSYVVDSAKVDDSASEVACSVVEESVDTTMLEIELVDPDWGPTGTTEDVGRGLPVTAFAKEVRVA